MSGLTALLNCTTSAMKIAMNSRIATTAQLRRSLGLLLLLAADLSGSRAASVAERASSAGCACLEHLATTARPAPESTTP